MAMLRLSHLFLMATQSFEPSADTRPFVSTWLQEMVSKAPNDFMNGKVLEQVTHANTNPC